jgi:uncharacterized protein YndB with AHSA1/START domain
MPTSTIKLHRVLRTTPEKLYRAFTEPGALAKWISPNGFYSTVHELDVRVGGKHSASFTNMTTGDSHSFGGMYLEIIPNEKLRYTDAFDDPNLPGEMIVTINIKKVTVGVELHIEQAGVPEAIPPDACYVGWNESLINLAALVEPNIPNG